MAKTPFCSLAPPLRFGTAERFQAGSRTGDGVKSTARFQSGRRGKTPMAVGNSRDHGGGPRKLPALRADALCIDPQPPKAVQSMRYIGGQGPKGGNCPSIQILRRVPSRTSTGSPPMLQRLPWAWRCKWKPADRPRICGPSGCRSLRPCWRRPLRRPAPCWG